MQKTPCSPFSELPAEVNSFSISSKVSVWESELQGDEDQTYLLNGVKNGFKISNLNEEELQAVPSVLCENHKSAMDHKEEVESELLSQIQSGYYVVASEPPRIISAIGAVPKDSGDVRIIHDGSRPLGEAMNDYSALYSVRYQTLSDACSLARQGSYLAKVDLKSAYRSVPIHPSDYSLTGLKWKFSNDDTETILFDSRLPFGARSSCSIFHRLTQSVRRMMARRGFNNIIVYLDDFCIISDSYEECVEAQHVLIKLLGELGFLVSWKKVLGPTTKLPFLGIEIDTLNCTLSLGEGKVAALREKLVKFYSMKRASKRQLQSLAGSLNFACQAVRGGRYFLRRILDVMNKLKLQQHKAKLSEAFKRDIEWWLQYIDTFNGVAYFDHFEKRVSVLTDASKVGGGAFCEGDWKYVNWKADMGQTYNRLHINYKEVLAVTTAAETWAPRWANTAVTVLTDNTVTKAVINRGHCRSNIVMKHLRRLFWLMVKYNFKLHAIHIPGKLNVIPDTISRLHEPGQCHHLPALLSNWSHKSIVSINWFSHMSPAAFQILRPLLPRTS